MLNYIFKEDVFEGDLNIPELKNEERKQNNVKRYDVFWVLEE